MRSKCFKFFSSYLVGRLYNCRFLCFKHFPSKFWRHCPYFLVCNVAIKKIEAILFMILCGRLVYLSSLKTSLWYNNLKVTAMSVLRWPTFKLLCCAWYFSFVISNAQHYKQTPLHVSCHKEMILIFRLIEKLERGLNR